MYVKLLMWILSAYKANTASNKYWPSEKTVCGISESCLVNLAVPSLPALGPWAPPAERGPSLESIYRVSLTVDLCEGQDRKLTAFIAPLSATIPTQHKNSPLL